MEMVASEKMRAEAPVMLTLTGVSKTFGSTRAVDDVSFEVRSGELLGVAGHNGAGKSTLFRLIHGDLVPDTGEVRRGGLRVRLVNQELVQPIVLRADEFASLRRQSAGPVSVGWRRSAWSELSAVLDDMFPSHGVRPADFLEDLPLSRRQMLECASVFVGTADEQSLFLMDEPTSALSDEDSAAFYRYISGHAGRTGSSFLITTHRLLEMTGHMDRVVVLRDGAVSTEVGAGAERDELTRAMGRITTEEKPAAARAQAPSHAAGEDARVVARVTQDAREGEPESVELRLGEVIGLAGLEGHGQGDCLVAFFTAARRRFGRRARTSHLKVETMVGAAYVSGDRRRRGVLPLWSVRDNLALASLRRLRRGPAVSTAAAQELYDDWARRLAVKGGADQNILALSGGNQQKVLLARALATGAPMVALDDPTRGVDQSTKEAMYELLRNEAAAGKCVVWFSTENDELRQCDRVLVFRNGRIAAELSGDSLTEDLVIQHSFQGEVAS